MIKLISFDFADTLACLMPSKTSIVKEYVEKHSDIILSESTIDESYHYLSNIIFYSSVDIITGEDRVNFYNRFNTQLFKLLGINHLVDASGFYSYIQLNKKHWKLKEGVAELLADLHKKGYLLSLVSNFDDCLNDILKDLGIHHYFHSIHISQTAGVEKPSGEFIGLPLTTHNFEAYEAVFIGDSYHLDFEPSNSLGYHAILLDEQEHYLHLGDQNRVTQLIALTNILKGL